MNPRYEDILSQVNDLFTWVIIDNKLDIFEGSSTPAQLIFLADTVKDMNLVREIGFNAGASACAMLAANPALRIISYDLGEWACVPLGLDFLTQRFGNRIRLVLGDTKNTLKRDLHPVDMTFIDGGHDTPTAYSDIKLAAPSSKFVIVDDLQIDTVAIAVEQAIEDKLITPVQTYADRDAKVPRSWLMAKGGVQ